MEQFYFFGLIRKSTISFLQCFDNIKVAKYDKDKNITDYVKVPLKLAGREKFYMWLNDRTSVKRLPMMAVSMGGLSFDNSRMGNKNHKYKFETTLTSGTSSTSGYNIQSNIYPWNMDFTLRIATLYMVEMNQILEQTLPYFDPGIFVTMDIPEINNSLNLKVILKSCNERFNEDLDERSYRNLLYELNFTVQSWLLRPIGDIGIIKEIDNFFYSSESKSEYEELIVRENLDG